MKFGCAKAYLNIRTDAWPNMSRSLRILSIIGAASGLNEWIPAKKGKRSFGQKLDVPIVSNSKRYIKVFLDDRRDAPDGWIRFL